MKKFIVIFLVLSCMGVIVKFSIPDPIFCGADNEDRVESDFANIITALKMYYLDHDYYPSSESGLNALLVMPESSRFYNSEDVGGYFSELPLDPWGDPYVYRNESVDNTSKISIESIRSSKKYEFSRIIE